MSAKRACDLNVEERAAIIRKSDFGSSLSESLLAELATSSTAYDFRRRRFVYRSGDEADALYVIERGRVKLCRIEAGSLREAVID
ncbi:MAG TPA: hypothetical protein VGO69_01950, partial [Pyrinomonadaceae bacterium]|nr:hypothetical protein [Pyrinomonadaceae bacterium]